MWQLLGQGVGSWDRKTFDYNTEHRGRNEKEEGRRGGEAEHGGSGRLSEERNRGEQEKRHINRRSHYRLKEKSVTRELYRDPQG